MHLSREFNLFDHNFYMVWFMENRDLPSTSRDSYDQTVFENIMLEKHNKND